MNEQTSNLQPVSELTIRHEEFPGGYRDLKVWFGGDGYLVMDAVDAGEHIRKITGDWDYEYSVTVPQEWTQTVLLHLLKERFSADAPTSDFMAWLKSKDIPYKFWDHA